MDQQKKVSVFSQNSNQSVFKSNKNSGGSLLQKNFSFPRLNLNAPKISEASSKEADSSPLETPKAG